MRKLKLFLSLLMLFAFSLGNVWAVDYDLVYTLDGSVTSTASGSSAYATAIDIVDNGITWNVMGNTTLNPWGIGGKNLSSTGRELFSKGAVTGNIAKIEIEHGAASSVTVNSMKVEVATDAAFSDIVSTCNPTFAANSTVTVNHPAGDDAWEDCYYRITYYLTIGNSNKKVEFKSAKFYKEKSASDPVLESITITGDLDNKSYEEGQSIDFAGLTATGHYNNSSTADLTDAVEWSFSPALTAGLTSVTATATFNEISGNKVINGLTVAEHAVTPGAYDIPTNNDLWGTSYSGTASGITTLSGSKNDVSITINKNTGSNMYVTSSQTRIYSGYTMIFSVPNGYAITALQFTADGSNWAGEHTADVGTMTDNKNWSGEANSVTISVMGTCRMKAVKVTYAVAAPSKAEAGLEYAEADQKKLTKLGDTFTAPTLVNPNNLTVAYASNNTDVAEVASNGAVTIKAAGVAVITASFAGNDDYKAGSASYTIGVTAHAGTEADPYNAADVKTAIDVMGTVANAYASGIVSSIYSKSLPTEGYISFYFSADGATSGQQIEAYKCYGLNSAPFEALSDVETGATVVVTGNLKKYNSTYEFDANCYLVSYEASETPKTDISNTLEAPYTVAQADELIDDVNSDLSKTVFVKGVVTGFATNKVTIRDTKNGEKYIELYKHTLAENISALQEDEIVIVKGTMQKYQGTTYQMNQGCQVVWKKSVALVKFLAPVDWENVYAYTFTWDEVNGTTEYDGAWPGKQLTKDGDWYAVNVPVDAKVIFHNNLGGDANQTVDIVADESKCYIWKGLAESGKMDVLAVDGCEMKYYIAGSEALTGQNWQHIALNEGNTITFNNVAAGDHQFKITNGTWDWNIGRTYASATGVTLWTEGDNVGFTTDKVMNITITYNPATEQITVAAEEVVAQAWSTVKFKAAGSDFAIKENVPQGQAYTIDLAENPWRPGYNFAGWSASEIASASEFTTPLTTITPDADEVTLYAVFSKEITPGSANYVKVTATEDITDGQYLIVYEDENVAFNGGLETLDAVSNTIGVEIEEDKIASNTTTDAAAFTIDVTNGTVKSASNLYIGVSSNSNGLKQTDDAATYTHNFSIDADKNAVITAAFEASTMTLRYNSATGQLRFRYYKNAGQQAIQLYKKVATPGTYSYTTDPATIYHIAGTPALTGEGTAEAWAHKALGEGNTITFDNVEAGEYKFKITDGTWDWSKGDAAVDKTNSSGVTFSETDGDGNVVFSIASETSVTITYDAANDKILVVAPIVRNYHIAGSEALTGQNWQHIALNEGNTITFNNVAAGDYEFKITDGTWNWYVSYAAENVDSENSNVTISESESNSNFKFTLAAKSNVTIAYNEETGKVTVNAEAIPEPKNVVILAEYNSKFYAMTNSLASGALAAVEVEKDNDKIVVFTEADKDAIQWTATTDGNNNTTLKDANDKYIKGSSGASLSLDEAAYNWSWDSEKSCYISSAYTSRGLFFNNSGVFKGYATSNLTNDAYAATEVIEIAAENIILSTKVDPELAFNPEEVTLTVGDEFVAPVLGSVEGFDGLANVTLESSNTSLAVVNEGVVSLVENATGTATITATFAGNSNYLPGTASYTITVNEVGDDLSGSWVLATAVPAVGQKVIIAATYQNETKAMGIQNSNNRAAVASTLEDDVLTPGAGTKVFTLVDAGDGKFAIQASNGNYLSAAGTGTSNYLKEAENFDEDNAKWTITIENGEANIVASSNNRNVLRYNSGNTIFSCYQSGAQRAINIYVQDTYTRPLEPNRYYTVCLPKKMMEVRGASFWTLSSRNTAETEAYLEEVDPTTAEAGTPFIIQATDTKLEVVYTGAATTTAGTNGALHGTLTYMDADALAAAGTNIYMLYNNALRPVGTNNHLDANRAYINYNELNPVTEAPQPAPGRRVRAVPMQQNTATGIDELNGSEAPAKVLINGQLFILRGEKMYDAKGLLVK